MNVVLHKRARQSRNDLEALQIIRRCGFIYRELNGDPWVTTGEPISVKRFERLLAMGLIEPRGDSLFGFPSQTYVPTKENRNVERSQSTSHSHQAG